MSTWWEEMLSVLGGGLGLLVDHLSSESVNGRLTEAEMMAEHRAYQALQRIREARLAIGHDVISLSGMESFPDGVVLEKGTREEWEREMQELAERLEREGTQSPQQRLLLEAQRRLEELGGGELN